MDTPIRNLTCCCCGELTRGRQWHNRDTGFGLCRKCSEWISNKETEENILSYYGVKRIHYCIDEPIHQDHTLSLFGG